MLRLAGGEDFYHARDGAIIFGDRIFKLGVLRIECESTANRAITASDVRVCRRCFALGLLPKCHRLRKSNHSQIPPNRRVLIRCKQGRLNGPDRRQGAT